MANRNTSESEARRSNALSLRDGIQAILLQGLGPASYFGLILILSRVWGPDVQGIYAHSKAWLDFIVAFGAFGLSQGLTYVIHRHNADAAGLMIGSLYVAACALVVLVLSGLLSSQSGFVSLPYTNISSVLLLSFAGAAGILMNLWRGILLSQTDGATFSMSFVVQPLALLTVVATTAFAALTLYLPLLFALTYLCGLLFVAFHLYRKLLDNKNVTSAVLNIGTLFRASSQAFIQNATVALVPIASIWLLLYHGATVADIGIWSIAMAMFQIINSPIAMVAPILFSRWAASSDNSALTQANRLASRLFLWSLLPTIGLCLCSFYLVPIAFGAAFSKASLAAGILAASMPFVMISRTIAPLMFANGSPGTLSWLYVTRLIVVVLLGGYLLGVEVVTRFTALAIGWSVAETTIAIVSWLWAKRQGLR